MNIKNIVSIVFVFLIGSMLNHAVFSDVSDPYFDGISEYFDSINQPDNPQLNYFLTDMPKGADLHNHLAGSAYPRWLISFAKTYEPELNWCVYQSNNYTAVEDDDCTNKGGILLRTLSPDSSDYDMVVSAWSMKDYKFIYRKKYGYAHFFGAFTKFKPLVKKYAVKVLAYLIEQAAQERIKYLELMVKTDDGSAVDYAKKYIRNLPDDPNKITYDDVVGAIEQLEQHNFTTNVVKGKMIPGAKQLLADAYSSVGCDRLDNFSNEACNVIVRFHFTANRRDAYPLVLAGLYAGLIATKLAPNLFVGVNIIGLEDGIMALKNYDAEMYLFYYLREYVKKHFPNSHSYVSLHAGELTDILENIEKNPRELTYHINNATNVAFANRIGHGVDIFAELRDHPNLINDMKGYPNPVAVEICLTSNEQILGVCDNVTYCTTPTDPYDPPDQYKFNHPFYYYLNASIPVVLSTDDQGIEQIDLEIDLVKEYYKALTRYQLTYQQLKDISRNSITFSFLPGQQLWAESYSRDYIHFVSQCANDNPYLQFTPSPGCQEYLKNNLRAQIAWDLETKFAQFEVGIIPISNCKDLQNISQNLSGSYRLIKDIDCSDTKNWNNGTGFMPINGFKGTLNGNNHTISNLYINNTKEYYTSLFTTFMDMVIINNMKLINANISSTTPSFTAALVGMNDGVQISNIHVTGNITADGRGYSTGGIIAYNNGGIITDSSFVGAISTNMAGYIGGLTGANTYNPSTKQLGEIMNSYADVVIKNGSGFVAGLAGANEGRIENSYAIGAIINGGDNVGGLVGINNVRRIPTDVLSSSGTISSSYATVDVSGNQLVGGLVGQANGVIQNSYSTGNVNGTWAVGGLIGSTNQVTIKDSYSTGHVSGIQDTGGLIGYANGAQFVLINDYYDSDTSGQHDTGKGVPKTTTEMMQENTFVDWDFVNIWEIESGSSCPWLRWQNKKSIGYKFIDSAKNIIRRPVSELLEVDF